MKTVQPISVWRRHFDALSPQEQMQQAVLLAGMASLLAPTLQAREQARIDTTTRALLVEVEVQNA